MLTTWDEDQLVSVYCRSTYSSVLFPVAGVVGLAASKAAQSKLSV